MAEQIILGIIQGIAEWIPVSSEGMLVLAQKILFGSTAGAQELVSTALFLHLGTFFAALVYFRKDVYRLARSFLKWSSASARDRKTISFLIWTTLISGLLGFIFLAGLVRFEWILDGGAGKSLTFIVGVLLLVTGVLQLISERSLEGKQAKEIGRSDTLTLGIAQGFSALPGLSRSGLTISALLLLKFKKEEALRLSFLMSLPIVLAGNIILGLGDSQISAEKLVGLLFAFLFGLLTIDALMKLSRKINFGWFVIFFSLLTFAAVLV